MSDKKFIISIIIATVVLLVVGVFLASKMGNNVQIEVNSEARAAVDVTSHDWGEIGIKDGNVEHAFTIKNEGSSILQLFNVKTSCMCTTAQLRRGNEKSIKFGMHSKSAYVMEVPPEEEAEIRVVFDPMFHGPNGVGSITRQVTVETNDAEKPELNFTLTAMVRR